MIDGYLDDIDDRDYRQAWTVYHLLVAAGCDPDKVTIAGLLGIKERSRPEISDQERKQRDFARMMARREKRRLKDASK